MDIYKYFRKSETGYLRLQILNHRLTETDEDKEVLLTRVAGNELVRSRLSPSHSHPAHCTVTANTIKKTRHHHV